MYKEKGEGTNLGAKAGQGGKGTRQGGGGKGNAR